MIQASDVEYHTPPGADYRWAETYIFPIAIPEEHILVMVYVAARPTLGVMLNEIYVFGTLTDNRAELLYVDSQVHLPAPKRFSDIDSPSGLKIKAVVPPREFRIDYVGFDDTEIHVDWNGIMDPFDVHDIKHTPHAVGTHDEKMAKSGLSRAWNGHFDMTGRVRGTVKVRGKEYPVDSLERMDHSWGERGEHDLPAMDSISAQFDENLAFHLIVAIDMEAPSGRDQKLAHGYVLEDGVQYGVVSMDITSVRLGVTVTSMHMTLTDVRGKTFTLNATADVGAPWNIYATTCYTALMRWTMGDRVGYGVVMEVLPIKTLTRLRGRRASAWPASITTG
ncbi:MAG: hypothetical protein V4609_09630 [Pseudomonadota bacterium]